MKLTEVAGAFVPTAGAASASKRIPPPPLTRATMVLYGLGSASNGIKNRGLSAFLLLFYNQVLGLPPTWVGAVIMIALMIDGLIDPVVGLISDNVRSRLGRRHPFMYISALPYAVFFCLIWNPPHTPTGFPLAVYLAFCIVGVRVFDTFFEVPASAMGPELTDDYDQRTTLISFRYFFTFVGGLALSLLAYQVFLKEGPGNPEGLLSRDGYGAYGLAAAAAIAVVILISTRATQSRIPWLHAPPARKLTARILVSEVIGTLTNRSLWVATASGVCAAVAAGFAGGLATYFNIYFWQLSTQELSYIVVAGFAASMLGIVSGPRFSEKFGKKRGAMILFAASLVTTILPVSLRLLGVLPPNGSPIVLTLLIGEALLSGAFGLMLSISITSMIADLAENSELQTGRRSEGLLVSADNFLKKTTSGVGVFTSSLVLTLVGFPDKAKPGQVPEAALHQLGLLYIPVIAVFYIGAILCLFAYRIDRSSHEATVRELRNRREGGRGVER